MTLRECSWCDDELLQLIHEVHASGTGFKLAVLRRRKIHSAADCSADIPRIEPRKHAKND